MTSLDAAILARVSRETRADLQRFTSLLEAFVAHTNLVAPSTLPDLWTRHLLDSAQLLVLRPETRRWLDLGSGGGFPGLVTAILLKGTEGAHVDLVESTGKKAAFLRSVIEELALPAQVWNERAEALALRLPMPEAVSARAVAPLPRLLDWAAPWLTGGAFGLFHKGRNFAGEVEESRASWDFDVIQHRSLTDSDAAILEIRDLRRT